MSKKVNEEASSQVILDSKPDDAAKLRSPQFAIDRYLHPPFPNRSAVKFLDQSESCRASRAFARAPAPRDSTSQPRSTHVWMLVELSNSAMTEHLKNKNELPHSHKNYCDHIKFITNFEKKDIRFDVKRSCTGLSWLRNRVRTKHIPNRGARGLRAETRVQTEVELAELFVALEPRHDAVEGVLAHPARAQHQHLMEDRPEMRNKGVRSVTGGTERKTSGVR